MLHVGICLPKSCTDGDVNRLVDTMLNSRIFGEKYYLDERFSIIESKTIKLRENFFGLTMVNIFLYVIIFQFFEIYTPSSRSFYRFILWFLLANFPFQMCIDIEFSFCNGWLTVYESCHKNECHGGKKSVWRFNK